MKLINMTCIGENAPHSAFTDLIYHGGRFFCCFREGESHALSEGQIRVLSSPDGRDWKKAGFFSLPKNDLRDPHFSTRPDGTLELIAGRAGLKDGAYTDRSSVETIWNGSTWTPLSPIAEEGDWLWRSHWATDDKRDYPKHFGGKAWSINYRLPKPRLWTVHLMQRSLESPWKEMPPQRRPLGKTRKTEALGLGIGGLPNEATVRSHGDGRLYILLRREGGGRNFNARKARGLVGVGTPLKKSFTECGDLNFSWRWYSLPWRIGGPNFIFLKNGGALASFRKIVRDSVGRRTGRAVLALAPPPKKEGVPLPLQNLKLNFELPSSGDASYTGLVEHNNKIWVSWYSSHRGKAQVYIGELELAEPYKR